MFCDGMDAKDAGGSSEALSNGTVDEDVETCVQASLAPPNGNASDEDVADGENADSLSVQSVQAGRLQESSSGHESLEEAIPSWQITHDQHRNKFLVDLTQAAGIATVSDMQAFLRAVGKNGTSALLQSGLETGSKYTDVPYPAQLVLVQKMFDRAMQCEVVFHHIHLFLLY